MLDDPDLSYHKFWDDLRARFARDTQASRRQNWEQVTLRMAGAVPTLQEWVEFAALYQGRRALVDGWSETEDFEHVVAELTAELLDKVLTEQNDRRKGQHLLRVTIPLGVHASELEQMFEGIIGRRPNITRRDGQQFVIACRDPAEQQLLQQWDQSKLDHKMVRIQPTQYQMSGDEVLDYVRVLLEVAQERARLMPLTRTTVNDRRGRTRNVTARPAEEARGQDKQPQSDNRASREAPPPSNTTRTQSLSPTTRKGKGKSKGTSKGEERRATTPPPPPTQFNTPSSTQFNPPAPLNPNGRPQYYTRFTPGQCNWCARHQRPSNHEWANCMFRQEYFAQRDARWAAEGRVPPGYPMRSYTQPPPQSRYGAWQPGPVMPNPQAQGAWQNGPPMAVPQAPASVPLPSWQSGAPAANQQAHPTAPPPATPTAQIRVVAPAATNTSNASSSNSL